MSIKTLLPVLITSILLPSSVFALDSTPSSRLRPTGIVKQIEEKLENRLTAKLDKLPFFLNNSTVTALGSNSFTINHNTQTFTINIDSKTQLARRFWGKMQFSEIQVGDKMNIVGRWTDEAKTTLLATHIRDLSLQKRYGVFIGKVTSVASSTWVIDTPNRGSETITYSTSTKITNRKGQTISPSDVVLGHIIRVRGLWDNKASTITEVAAVKDYTLPLQPKTSASPSATPTP